MPKHKHCENCGLDFEPKQVWEQYCSQKCVQDYQRLHPPMVPPPNQIPLPYVPSVMPTQFTYWNCGICGKAVPMNENHQHSITFTTGNP